MDRPQFNFSLITWITIAVVGGVLFVTVSFGREYVRNMDIAAELTRLQKENAALEGKRLQSVELIDQLATETYVEENSRLKLNLARPGETVYVVEDGEAAENGKMQQGQVDSSANVMSNPKKWFHYFFYPSSQDAL